MKEKRKEISLEEAQAKLMQHQQKRMQEFATKLQVLLNEYNLVLTARFGLFGQMIEPPISAMPKPPEAPG